MNEELEHISVGNCPSCNHFPTQFIAEVGGETTFKALPKPRPAVEPVAVTKEIADTIDAAVDMLNKYHECVELQEGAPWDGAGHYTPGSIEDIADGLCAIKYGDTAPPSDEAVTCEQCGAPTNDVQFCAGCWNKLAINNKLPQYHEAVRLLDILVEELIQGGASDKTIEAALKFYYRNDSRIQHGGEHHD